MNRAERRHAAVKKRSTWWIWALIIAAVIAGFVIFQNTRGTGVDYTQYSYTDDLYAAPDAVVVLEEFSDFQCPYCQDLAPTIRAVRDSHKDDVRVVYKQFPLRTIHPFAQKAAEATECGREQNKFWAFHDVVFESKKLDERSLKLHAEGLGLDMAQWNTCMKASATKAKISQDLLEGQQRDVSGTPSIFLNGQQFGGRTLLDFQTAIANAKNG